MKTASKVGIGCLIAAIVIFGSCIGLVIISSLFSAPDDYSDTTEVTTTKTKKETPTSQPKEVKAKAPKKFKLGQGQQGDYWKYVPKEVKRTTSINGDFGSSKPAGSGQEYILLYVTVQNVTNETQHTDFTFDPQPVLLSGNQEYEYDDSNSYYLKDSFEEAEDVAPSGTQSGWLLFKIPAGKKGFKLKIEDFVWDLNQ